jgi:hypothetical protein
MMEVDSPRHTVVSHFKRVLVGLTRYLGWVNEVSRRKRGYARV